MKKPMLLAITVAVAMLAGCGSNRKEIERLRTEQQEALDQVRKQVETLGSEMRRMRDDISELDNDLFELKGHLDFALIGARGADDSGSEASLETAEAAGSETATEAATAEEVPVELIEADLETLAVELTKMRDEVAKLRTAYESDKELAELRDPRLTWEAMGDPERLSRRLDRFAKEHAATIEDETTREQFLADVKALQEQVTARANMTTEEQVEHYQARLGERINTESNQRMRRWYEQQLSVLTTGDEGAVERQLERAVRFDNARGVGEVASKYSISRETLRDNGLQSFGGGRFGGRGR